MKNPRTGLLVLLFLLVAGLGAVRAQSFEWARGIRSVPDTSAAFSTASATDASGNTYAVLTCNTSLLIDGVVFSKSPYDEVIVKYNNTGTVLWAKQLTSMRVVRLAPDNVSGGVFVLGVDYGSPNWDGIPLPASTSARFYAKCLASGQLQWTNPLPNNYGNAIIDDGLTADEAGNVYVIGTPGSSSNVGGTAVGVWQNYLLKANGAGVTQWVQLLHNGTGNRLSNLIIGPKPGGGCLVSGGTAGRTLYLGPSTATPLLTPTIAQAKFLTSFDAAGAVQWTQQMGTTASTSTASINIYASAADANGNCYITGSTNGVAVGSTALNPGFFLVKYNAAGILQWTRDGQIPAGATSTTSSGLLLVANNSGATVIVSAGPPFQIGTLVLRAPYNVVRFNDTGTPQWTVADAWMPPAAGAFSPYFYLTGLGQDADNNVYLVGATFDKRRGSIPAIQLGAQTVVGKAAIVTRINNYANTVRGQVYFDQNANGQRDTGEGLFPRQLTGVLAQGSATTYAAVGTDGVLQAYAGTGAYSLSLTGLTTPNHTVTQPASGSYTGTFAGTSQLVDNQDFGVAPVVNQTDLRLTLTPYGVARAGLTTRYRLTLENVGTTTIPAGTATLTLDALMQYISSTPAGTVAGRVLSLPYATLAPFGTVSYDVLFSLPTNAALGTVLSSPAAAPVAGDVAPADNTATLTQTVMGPYDPNSIEVNYSRLTPAQVAARQPLDYTIHFQNLGTAPAQNVILSDTLDFQKLNTATLMLVAQSHNCSWSLSSIGPNTGLLTVRFLGINLPEQNADVIRSMGFVRFRVQPRPTLVVGEVIPNHASIVFDYNAGIRTNTATTTVFLATAAQAGHETPAWEAYPNPAADVLNVALDLPTAGPVRVELLDLLGRSLRRQTITAPAGPFRQTVDLRGLAAGVYVLRLTPPTGLALSRQVVRQ